MYMTIEIHNCADCPAAIAPTIRQDLWYCNLLLYDILERGDAKYPKANLTDFPNIPDNCPCLEEGRIFRKYQVLD